MIASYISLTKQLGTTVSVPDPHTEIMFIWMRNKLKLCPGIMEVVLVGNICRLEQIPVVQLVIVFLLFGLIKYRAHF